MLTDEDRGQAATAYYNLLDAAGVNLENAVLTITEVTAEPASRRRRRLLANSYIVTFVFQISNVPTSVAAQVCLVGMLAVLCCILGLPPHPP